MTAPIDGPAIAPIEGGASEEAAKQLEAYFLRRVLSEVKIGQSGMLSGGFAGETFQQMYSEAIADAMAEAGGIGISDVIMGQLEGDAASIAARPPPALAGASGIPGALRAPVRGRVSSSFGSRIHPISGERKFHSGLDIAAPTGHPARAAAPGEVIRAERAGGYGNLVVVKHPGGLETRYAHLSKIDVVVGQRIEAGAKVGEVGQTGTATGPHLHFEVRQGGRAKDPKGFLNGENHSGDKKKSQKMTAPLKPPPESPNRFGGGY